MAERIATGPKFTGRSTWTRALAAIGPIGLDLPGRGHLRDLFVWNEGRRFDQDWF
jgi:hypothetical protein